MVVKRGIQAGHKVVVSKSIQTRQGWDLTTIYLDRMGWKLKGV